MARKRLIHICFLVFVITAKGVVSQCSPHKIAKSFKPHILPYRYDNYSYNELTFTDKSQIIEVTFTAFATMKYKLVFGSSTFDENVKVSIYDKSIHTKNRTKLYDNTNGADNLFWSVEVGQPGVYYIDYEVPPKGDSKSADGCMVMLIGFQKK